MEFTIVFKGIRGETARLERLYKRTLKECQAIVASYSKEYGGIGGYSARDAKYGGLEVYGAKPNTLDRLTLREHFSQNARIQTIDVGTYAYGTVVTACLTLIKHRLGDVFHVSSNGDATDWQAGVDLARNVTGLKLKNPMPKRAKPETPKATRAKRLVAGIVLGARR